jgi:GTP cyclohydrolase II
LPRFRPAGRDLRDLRIARGRLRSNNPRKAAALAKNGMEVAAWLACEAAPTPHLSTYLRIKRDKLGHALSLPTIDAAQPVRGIAAQL